MRKILCLLLTVLLAVTSAAAVFAADTSGRYVSDTTAECEPPIDDTSDVQGAAPAQGAASGGLNVAARSINEIRAF